MKNTIDNLLKSEKIKGVLAKDVSMKKYNSWRVGGFAEYLYKPYDADDLSIFLQLIKEKKKITWIGLGSNILVRDQGIEGVVIVLHPSLGKIIFLQNNTVYVEAGASCVKLSQRCAEKNLTGIEFLSGIPGTVGGALAMNAGAYGSEIWDFVHDVKILDSNGVMYQRTKKDFDINYREVSLSQNECFVAAHLSLEKAGNDLQPIEKIKVFKKERSSVQPVGAPSCGSVFKNPADTSAGTLIERAGLKGYKVGRAEISKKHANFIINTGEAKAADIESLILHIQSTVEKKFRIKLETEVKFIGTR